MHDYLLALLGGALIGISVSLMLWWNGRVTGISGIIYAAAVEPAIGDRNWRWSFIVGMLGGGLLLHFFYPRAFEGNLASAHWTLVVGGLLVGFGTLLGNGCTSGHGVCGISRLSPRSLLATITFMVAGILSVYVFRKLGVFI
ncbi:MAG: YeeE/YedE family protein [Bdellovibrionaceae bacterium]|nr:YeeE/YedE family protein [Pseudobdellovibrionaceae bacterium]